MQFLYLHSMPRTHRWQLPAVSCIRDGALPLYVKLFCILITSLHLKKKNITDGHALDFLDLTEYEDIQKLHLNWYAHMSSTGELSIFPQQKNEYYNTYMQFLTTIYQKTIYRGNIIYLLLFVV